MTITDETVHATVIARLRRLLATAKSAGKTSIVLADDTAEALLEALTDTLATPSPDAIEAGAKILAGWIGYSWDGLSDRDISDQFPDWVRGSRAMQGGKPALRKVVARILSALAPHERGGVSGYAPISDEQIREIVNCTDVSTARIKIARLVQKETGTGEAARLRRMVERRDEFIIANNLWHEFKDASSEAK